MVASFTPIEEHVQEIVNGNGQIAIFFHCLFALPSRAALDVKLLEQNNSRVEILIMKSTLIRNYLLM
jgi:hypothetical protein